MIKRKNKNKIRCAYCTDYINGNSCIHTKCVESYVKKVINKSIIVTVFDKKRILNFISVISIIFLFLISNINALELTKEYQQEKDLVSFVDSKQEQKVTIQMIKNGNVVRGKDRNVLIFNLTNYKSETVSIQDMEILNMKNQKIQNKEFKLKYLQITEEINIKKTIKCDEKISNLNGSDFSEKINCLFESDGIYFSQNRKWVDSNYIKVGEGQSIIIGLFTNVDTGDYYDGIPYLNISGEIHKLQEFGIWKESLQDSLIAYFNMNHNISNQMTDSYRGKYNLTFKEGTPAHMSNISGNCLTDGCINFQGTESYRSVTFGSMNTSNPLSFSFWTYKNANAGNKRFITTGPDSGVGAFLITDASVGPVTPAIIHSYAFGSDWDYPDARTSFGTLQTMQWYHIAVVWDGTKGNNPSYKLYVDGRYYNWTGNGGESLITDFSTNIFTVGGWEDKDYINAKISNVGVWHRELTDGGCSSDVSANNVTCGGEISDLYNNGFPVDLVEIDTESPLITIKNPLNQSYTTQSLYINTTSNEPLNTCIYSFDEFLNNQTMISFNDTDFYHLNDNVNEGNLKLSVFCNDTSGNENKTEFLNFKVDVSSPVINITNQEQFYNISFEYDINSYDIYSEISTYSINDTVNFVINKSTGLLKNNTVLSVQIYYINITVNDTLNNIGTGILQIDITNYSIPVSPPESSIISEDSFFYIDLTIRHNLYFIILYFIVASALIFTKFRMMSAFMFLIGGFLLIFSGIHFLISLVPFLAAIILGDST